MSETVQTNVFGTELEPTVEIETTGRVIKPLKRIIGQVVGEARLHCEDDGIHFNVVDAANVMGSKGTLYASALEEYETEDTILGVGIDDFGSILQHARHGKSTDDTVELVADDAHISSTTHRTFAETDARIDEQRSLVDVDSIRPEPEWTDYGGCEVQVSLEPRAFAQVLSAFDLSSGEQIHFKSSDGSLVFEQAGDTYQRRIALDAFNVEDCPGSIYSTDYLKDIRSQLRDGLIDSISLLWDEQYPLFVEMEREDVYEVTTMLAPRVKA